VVTALSGQCPFLLQQLVSQQSEVLNFVLAVLNLGVDLLLGLPSLGRLTRPTDFALLVPRDGVLELLLLLFAC